MELTKLRSRIVEVQKEIDAENARMVELHARIHQEMERLKAEAWRLGVQREASEAVYERRCHSGLPPNLEPQQLFNTPQLTPGTVQQPGNRQEEPAQPPLTHSPPRRFQTPRGHFSNPVDNMLAATQNMEALPMNGNSPIVVEARNAIEMLKTAVVQQAQYSYSRDRMHSTPYTSKGHNVESPAVSSSG